MTVKYFRPNVNKQESGILNMYIYFAPNKRRKKIAKLKMSVMPLNRTEFGAYKRSKQSGWYSEFS